MARTRSRDYDSIQDSILDKTAELFAARGYVASSISDIAEACQCSKSRLYHYFECKEAILIAILRRHVDKLLLGAREVVAEHADPTERFGELIRFFMEIYAVSRSKHVVLLTCMEFLPDAHRREIIDKQRELISHVRNVLKAILPDHAKAGLSNIDTMLFFGMINWTYTWYRPDGAMRPHDLADRCVDIFLHGYSAAAGGGAARGEAAAPRKRATSLKKAG